ncbi:diguanylate cyclase [Vibrio anguillarum]|uniref:diguanylate cyclase n=1 Tax=Vibrio anguillarum TaxID=55601 RepID=UPI000BB47780|nr:diguanylate cyclase [Vibrio anguillarum]ATC59247.1 sensor domain-containing diguanylate cyclase [Vibrio anguillarum]MBF4251372.1 sensor domain-containing diguanylate cyclase [Vibrio anguillarum]MBF4388765.1 sensor domain-containing diguanylate cyclase [Vibrio anguillarum]MBF4404029.1 sensor domain-containing diguanylate cyclase [Vibrio anguillarum]
MRESCMRHISGKQWSVNLLLVAFIIFCGGLIEIINFNQRSFIRDNLQTRAKEELSIIRAQLEAAILSDIYVANGLTSLIAINAHSQFEDWEKIAANILHEGRHLRVIGLAPDDVIRYTYPLSGNHKTIGLDYRTVPKQWATILKAREIQEIFIAGPVNLVQGGRGLVARIPIFTDPPDNQQYWGVCSVVIDLDSLLLSTGVERFTHRFNLAIRGVDSTGSKGEVFFGEQEVFTKAFAKQSVHFPYGGWEIAVAQKSDVLGQVPWYQVHIVRLLGYPILILLVAAFITIYRLYSIANERALHDELTQLPNRRYFMYTLDRYFEQAIKMDQSAGFVILNIDIDKFKSINDTYGHAAGDKVLIACAERVKSVLRSSDLVARIGGDEFLVLLSRVSDNDDIERISLKIKSALCNAPVIYEQHLINLHVSVGAAAFSPEFDNVDAMLKLADERMYQEKRQQYY